MEKADRPCIFAIDEFQQITKFPEKNVEALLRAHIQKARNSLFIYAGSNRHILENMFHSSAKPFYNSSEQLYLECIPRDLYVNFAIKLFGMAGMNLTREAAEYAYDRFEGHTYYVHNLLHNVFSVQEPGKDIVTEDIHHVLLTLLGEKQHTFSYILNQLNYQEKDILIAIAKEGKASSVTSVGFVKRHALKSPSAVQYAISMLLDKQILTSENEGRRKEYSLSDRFLSEWIKITY